MAPSSPVQTAKVEDVTLENPELQVGLTTANIKDSSK